jgi:hypothetical protein
MATATNPKILDIDSVEEVWPGVASSQTGKMGIPVKLTSGLVTVCSNGDIPYGLLGETIDTAKATSTPVRVYRLNVGTRLEMHVASGGASSAVATANLGLDYDLRIISNLAYVDIGATTDKCFRIVDLAANYEPTKNSASDDPGKCVVEVIAVQSA